MKKYSSLLLIIGFGALLLTQQKFIMPWVYEIVSSDLFLVGSKDEASQLPISSHLTDLAFKHCNQYIKSKLDSDNAITFSEKPINSWSLGNYQYVINAEASLTAKNTNTPSSPKYVCRITYNKGDDQSGIEDFDNWSVSGISGLENM